MTDLLASKESLSNWIHGIARNIPTFFPQKYGKSNFRFDLVKDSSQLQFESYRPTIVPPGKKLSPSREKFFKYKKMSDEQVEFTAEVDETSRVLAGVRPCDLKAIALMDLAFGDGVRDPYYDARRKNTVLIAYLCPQPCDNDCFCAATDSLSWEHGADILLTPLGENLIVEPKTEKGVELLAGVNFSVLIDSVTKKKKALLARPKPFGRQLNAETSKLPEILVKQWKSPLWNKHVEKCFSCGTCNMVCPTCYCFDVRDDINLDVSSGFRERTWDSCMLPDFAVVAGGHNFRQDPATRQRHRVKRKFEYLNERYGKGSFCVGCGRCGRQCTSDIDIFNIINDLVASQE